MRNKKNTASTVSMETAGPLGKIPTKKEQIRTLRFTLPYNN